MAFQGDSALSRGWNASNGGRSLVKKLWGGKLHPRVPAVMIVILATILALKQKNYDAVLADGRIRGSYRTDDVVPVPQGIQLIARVSSLSRELGIEHRDPMA